MKKDYLKPEVSVIELDTECTMLTGSTEPVPVDDSGEEYDDNDDGKGGSWVIQR